MAKDGAVTDGFVDMGLGKCLWFGGNHEKAAVICGRVYFNFDAKYTQPVDWKTTDENESDFANIQKGPLLTR